MARIVSDTGLDVDVEAALVQVYRQALAPGFPGLVVATVIPRSARGELAFPQRLVTPSRAGGVALSPAHDQPMVTTHCWAPDPAQAWELTGAARVVARALSNECVVLPPLRPGGDSEVVWVSYYRQVGGPAELADPRTKHARYQFTDLFTVRR